MSRNACSGKNGETGEKSPASGDLNWMPKMAPWRLAILAKMAILAEIGDFGKNRQRAGDNNDKRPRSLETGNFGENGDCSEIGNFGKNRQKCMQWRKWQTSASLWRFTLDAKSDPLEAIDFGENGDFGEIGDFGKYRQRAGDIQNVAKYSNWTPKVGPSK